MHDAIDNEFAELLPPETRPHECAKFLFDRRVNCLVHLSSVVEVAVKPCVPRLVELSKLPVLNERSDIVIPGKLSGFLVVTSRVAGQYRDGRCVPFHNLWCNLCIMFLCRRYVNTEHGVGRRIDQ